MDSPFGHRLHLGELFFEGLAHAVEAVAGIGILFALLVEQGEEIVFLQAVELVDALRQVFLKVVKRFLYFLAGGGGIAVIAVAESTEF